MEFLAKHLWEIYEIATASGKDGTAATVDMGGADDLFIHNLTGADKAEWESCNQDKAKREYDALVIGTTGIREADKYKELCAAFLDGDRAAFDKAVACGLAALYRSEGVDD